MNHCPSCGQPSFEAFEGSGRRCSACGYTLFANPGSAAAVFLKNDAGDILGFRREREPSKGKWAIPGGFLDPLESFETAAIREAQEEVGLVVNSVRYLTSSPNQYVYKGIRYYVVDTYFVSSDFGGEIRAQAGEVGKWAWLNPRTVPMDDWAFPSLRHAVKQLLAENSGSPSVSAELK